MTIVNQTALLDTQTGAISIGSLPAAFFSNVPVVTTEVLATLYGTEPKHIQNNHLRNASRFVDGKHFFKVTGSDLKEFKNRPSLRGLVGNKAKSLILWTERGAARHAKMLETDQAWSVFEKLEDCYFSVKAEVEKHPKQSATTTDERTPLRDAINLLVGKKGIMYPEAYSFIHQRFNIAHIDELPPEQLPMAVEYIHRLALEGELMEPERQGIQPNYLVCVRIKDEITGGKIEFNLSAETVVSLVTGISTCLGYAPTGFNKVPVQKKMMRQIH